MLRNGFKTIVVALLTLEARAVLKKYKPKIIAITGSVGKTSTKDAIFAVLAQKYFVRKSEKSFNSEVGLPLTILGVPNGWNNPLRWVQNLLDGLLLVCLPAHYPEWLVLEVGADRPGDITRVARWLKPEVVVITRLPEVPVHVEFFDSPEEVVEEKAALIDALQPGGALVLFGDEEREKKLAARASGAKISTFGFSEHADVRAHNPELLFESGREHFPIGMQADITVSGTTAHFEILGTVGAHALYPVLAAAAVGHVLGMHIEEIIKGIESYDAPPGRMHLVRGIKDTVIIDDTYNSSPAAAHAALDTIEAIKKSDFLGKSDFHTIAVLGDMLELGKHSAEEHRKLGERAAQVVDLLVTIGFRAHGIAEGALGGGMGDADILQYEDARAAGAELKNMLAVGDIILVKGSQGMRAERVVEEIMQEPTRAAELLVRQDREWKKR